MDAKSFIGVVNGKKVNYKCTDKGYYYKDNLRIKESEFEEAKKFFSHKAKKPSKDVSFEHNGITLTSKQVEFMNELHNMNHICIRDRCWTCEDITNYIGGQFTDKPMTIGAMMSTLCEKDLARRFKEKRTTDNGRVKNETMFMLTDKGHEMWLEMGLL